MIQRIIDHHVHTNYSRDASSEATFIDYIKQAKQLQLPGVMFTDHVDIESPDPLFQKLIDYDHYVTKINELKEQTDIDVLMGVEVGYQPHIHKQLQSFLSKYPFDFVICSMHVCDQLDFYNGDFFKGKNQQQSYTRYFEAVLESVNQYDDYDVYGHLDYITRYGGFQNKEYKFNDYQVLIDEILKIIIEKGKGIELNTSGIRNGLGAMHPKFDVIKRYKELGGDIITIGSDAHFVDHLYENVEDGIMLLKSVGFKYVTHFKNRLPLYIKL